MIIEIVGALLVGLAMTMALSAHRRERPRIAPVDALPLLDVPDIGFYDLAASRIRPETLYEIERKVAA